MNRLSNVICLIVVITLSGCSALRKPKEEVTNKPAEPVNSAAKTQPTTSGGLQAGQASGSYTAKGETVELKYAYAGRGERFGKESIIIIVTDKPVPADAVAEEIKSQPLFDSGQIRGLEYVIDDEGMWVRFHPSQYQESSSNKLKDYAVEGDIVRGTDVNDGGFTDEKYSRSVKFVATIVK